MSEGPGVYRLYHPNRRECPTPRWVGQGDQRLFIKGVLQMPQGHYECGGHTLEGRTIPHHILKEVADGNSH